MTTTTAAVGTASVGQEQLLTADQLAQFVIDGFLEFDDLIPADLNQAVLEDERRAVSDAGIKPEFRWHVTDNRHGFYEFSEALRAVHELPAIRAILQSLLGPEPTANHSALHVTPPHKRESQSWHVDAGGRRQIRIPRDPPFQFDVLTAYFAHDVPDDMGPTLVLPGSHMRSLMGQDLGRYKNVRGQKRLAGPGGRIVFLHDALWHCAQPNATDQFRFMFKIRFNPRVPQQRLFNVDGWDSQPVRDYFLRHKNTHVLTGEAPAVAAARAEWWRYLCGAEPLDDPSGTRTHGDYA